MGNQNSEQKTLAYFQNKYQTLTEREVLGLWFIDDYQLTGPEVLKVIDGMVV